MNEQYYEAQTRKRIIKNISLVGRFFKTRDNYSCPRSGEDYWWVYTFVSALKAGWPVVTSFYRDKKNGKIIVQTDSTDTAIGCRQDDSIEISETEFQKKWQEYSK